MSQTQTDFSAKRKKRTQLKSTKPPPVLPGLPEHIAQLCLSRVQPSLLFNVCRSWRRLIYSPSFPPFLSLYTLLSSKSHQILHFYSFDPVASTWEPLPPPPDPPIDLLLHHPSFLSRKLPVQSVSVSGKLVLLAATTHNFYPALTRPLLFNPIHRNWVFGPPLNTPRRWCAAGSLHNVVYVASGIGYQFSTEVARSVEKWDLQKNKYNNNYYHNGGCGGGGGRWEKMKGLKDGTFCRDAVDAVGWRGKLCMVNVKGYGAKEGVVYDVERDTWREMPEGMIKGWRGPVAAMDEEVMLTVDETNGALRKYDEEKDDWEEMIIQSNMLVGAQQIACGGGRVCVVGGEGGIVVVDVVAAPPRIWAVDTPNGFQALAVHILPRMSQSVPTDY
ncbi:F-box/kelch-repeat protein SKIP25-like [Mangifera indica]|uniref:F-box/kelch-repeat protein SKIP25-like n=1 Tax=Mangifera indica TaxID=29780 RepID=UPI001CF9BE3C|nr:F-box/kelch-repeat protein SKIP25-like [Mangifera indica]